MAGRYSERRRIVPGLARSRADECCAAGAGTGRDKMQVWRGMILVLHLRAHENLLSTLRKYWPAPVDFVSIVDNACGVGIVYSSWRLVK